jgi:hypothetical protein
MEQRWYKAWPTWCPKTLEVEEPTSEYIRNWAELAPDRIALTFYGNDFMAQRLPRSQLPSKMLRYTSLSLRKILLLSPHIGGSP